MVKMRISPLFFGHVPVYMEIFGESGPELPVTIAQGRRLAFYAFFTGARPLPYFFLTWNARRSASCLTTLVLIEVTVNEQYFPEKTRKAGRKTQGRSSTAGYFPDRHGADASVDRRRHAVRADDDHHRAHDGGWGHGAFRRPDTDRSCRDHHRERRGGSRSMGQWRQKLRFEPAGDGDCRCDDGGRLGQPAACGVSLACAGETAGDRLPRRTRIVGRQRGGLSAHGRLAANAGMARFTQIEG